MSVFLAQTAVKYNEKVMEYGGIPFGLCFDINEEIWDAFNRFQPATKGMGELSEKGETMEIATRKEGNSLVVTVKGRIDAVTAPEFEKGLSALIAEDGAMVLNFAALEYISSAGLRSILMTAKQIKAKNGKLVFVGLKGPVKDVFKISGFGSIFTIFDTEAEALRQG